MKTPSTGKQMVKVAEGIVGVKVFNEVCLMAVSAELRLWGLKRPPAFSVKCVAIAIYKDFKRYGYGALAALIRKWFPTTPKTLQHNQRVIRLIWKNWAKDQITLGVPVKRKRVASRTTNSKEVPGVTLWIDSTDFPVQGRRKVNHFPPPLILN